MFQIPKFISNCFSNMKKIIIGISILSIALINGQKIENKVVLRNGFLVSSSNIMPGITISENGVLYDLAFGAPSAEPVDLSQPLKVVYKATKSAAFRSPEGYGTASTYRDVKNISKLEGQPGWAYYVKLPSGWNAAFDFHEKPKNDSKILFFFKKYSVVNSN